MARHYGKLWQIMTNYDKLWQIMSKRSWIGGKKDTWKLSGISNFAPIKDVERDKKLTWNLNATLEEIDAKRDTILN